MKHQKECFNSHTVYNISGAVTELCDIQSATVRRQGEKIKSLHDRISEGKQCFLSHMPQAIRTDGLMGVGTHGCGSSQTSSNN